MSNVDPWTFSRGELNKIFEDLSAKQRKESYSRKSGPVCMVLVVSKNWVMAL